MKNQTIKNILKSFSDEFVKRVKSEIHAIIWYGSTARGDATKESDIDVVIIAQEETDELWKLSNETAAKYSLEYDCLISIVIISKNRFERMKNIGRLLATNISKEGKILWQRAA